MHKTVKTFTSEGADVRKWIGGMIMAVILGEAIWSLIVSVMNNLVVPWLGDVMGQSSGLPTSFTQRPYDYPALRAGLSLARLSRYPGRKRFKVIAYGLGSAKS
jgi:hypothetical protein